MKFDSRLTSNSLWIGLVNRLPVAARTNSAFVTKAEGA